MSNKKYPGMTRARMSVLVSHYHVAPKGVAWTSALCAKRTWDWLYENGYLAGGKLTPLGEQAVSEYLGTDK